MATVVQKTVPRIGRQVIVAAALSLLVGGVLGGVISREIDSDGGTAAGESSAPALTRGQIADELRYEGIADQAGGSVSGQELTLKDDFATRHPGEVRVAGAALDLSFKDDYATRHPGEVRVAGAALDLSFKDDYATRHPGEVRVAGAAPDLSFKDDYATRHMSAGRKSPRLRPQDDYGTRHLGRQP